MTPVLITVDVDSVTPMIDEVPAASTGQHVDELEQRMFGLRVGVPRILNALGERGLRATFFVPGLVAERSPETVASVVDAGHEVGLHGWRHTPPRAMSQAQLEDDLARSREALHRAGAGDVRGYRAPEWQVTANLLSALNSTDLLYDSSMGGYENPYRLTGRADPLIELPVSWALDDAPFLLCTSRSYSRPMSGTALGEQWCRDLAALARHGSLGMLTVHPWIIGRAPAFVAFEAVLDHVAENSEQWTGTASELIDRIDLSRTPLVDPNSVRSWWEDQ